MPRILIIKLGALGDVVMATALIRQIQRNHTRDELWLLTAPPYSAMFKDWAGLHVMSCARRGVKNLLGSIAWIRNAEFRRVYDLQSSDRSAILCALSGIPERIGNHPRFPYNLHPPDKYAGQCHIHERMLAVLRAGGIDPMDGIPELPLAPKEKEFVREWLANHSLPARPFVILHPGASPRHPEKRWPYFPELALALKDHGYTIVWAGADPEREMIRKFSGVTGIDAVNVFSINMLAEAGRYARFAVTNDSGPMHILSCSGIPVFALFGPTDWRRNHALGQRENVIVAAESPPGTFGPAALENITPERVLQLVRERKLI